MGSLDDRRRGHAPVRPDRRSPVGRRVPAVAALVAATAIVEQIPVVTLDIDDEAIPCVEVIRVWSPPAPTRTKRTDPLPLLRSARTRDRFLYPSREPTCRSSWAPSAFPTSAHGRPQIFAEEIGDLKDSWLHPHCRPTQPATFHTARHPTTNHSMAGFEPAVRVVTTPGDPGEPPFTGRSWGRHPPGTREAYSCYGNDPTQEARSHQPPSGEHIGANPMSSIRTKAAAVAGLLAMLCTVAACGTSSSTSSTAANAKGSSAASAGLTAVRKALAKYEADPTFQAPGPPIDVAQLKGKTIYSIPQSSAIPFLSITDKAEAAIAKQYGIKFVEYPNQGTPTDWIQGIEQAIAAHAGAIILNALDPSLVGPQLKQARAAGIPTISAQYYDLTQLSSAPKALTAIRPDNFTEAGKLEADWAISATNGHANVLVVENREQLSTLALVKGLKAQFSRYCASCTVQYLNVPATQWATEIQPEVQSALAANSKINYVIPIYDPMSPFVIAAIEAAGKTDSVHIATFNGTPFALKDLADGDIIRMDIGENLNWLAYANMDETFRAMLGKPTVVNEHTPQRVFTAANIAQTGNPPAYNRGFGSSYVSGYQKLWSGK